MRNKVVVICAAVALIIVMVFGVVKVTQQKQKADDFSQGLSDYEAQINQNEPEQDMETVDESETYYFDEVIRDVHIEEIVSVSRVEIPENLSLTVNDLPEEMQTGVIFGYESEDVAIACYYAALETYGSDVLLEYSDLVAGISYEGYNNRIFKVNGELMQFVFNEEEVYIKEYLQQ